MSKSDSHDSRHGNAAPQEDQDLDGLSPEARRILADEAEEERKANLPPPEDPGLEATELELKWYKMVADDARYGVRLFGWALISTGLCFFAAIAAPTPSKGGYLSWESSSAIGVAFAFFVFLLLLGLWAFRMAAFPKVAPKIPIEGCFDISVAKGAYRRWIGSDILLAPRRLTKTLQVKEFYTGEGFLVETGGESWIIPTKLGTWKISATDKYAASGKQIAWLCFAAFQIAWPIACLVRSPYWPDRFYYATDWYSAFCIIFGILSTAAIALTIVGSIGIIVFRKIRELRERSTN